jgi:hypothetical protein
MNTITANELKHIFTVAADGMEGRETGSAVKINLNKFLPKAPSFKFLLSFFETQRNPNVLGEHNGFISSETMLVSSLRTWAKWSNGADDGQKESVLKLFKRLKAGHGPKRSILFYM